MKNAIQKKYRENISRAHLEGKWEAEQWGG